MGCDFNGNDLFNTSLSDVSLCGDTCVSLRECTHFTYTPDGTCWMKTGTINTNQAIRSRHPKSVCGIVLITSDDNLFINSVFDKSFTTQAFRKEIILFILLFKNSNI